MKDFICNKTWWQNETQFGLLFFVVTVKWEQSIKCDMIAACNWFLINCRFVGVARRCSLCMWSNSKAKRKEPRWINSIKLNSLIILLLSIHTHNIFGKQPIWLNVKNICLLSSLCISLFFSLARSLCVFAEWALMCTWHLFNPLFSIQCRYIVCSPGPFIYDAKDAI